MKFDSPLFDSVRVKPGKDRRPKTGGPACQWAGCKEKASHRAPKGRENEKDYWRFCLEHVRQYNQSYNFFKGMNDAAVMAYQKDAHHRPSPDLEDGNRQGARRGRIFAPSAAAAIRSACSAKACAASSRRARRPPGRSATPNARRSIRLGLDIGATPHQVKMRFKELVKQFHPDANGGDRSTEDRLVEVIQVVQLPEIGRFRLNQGHGR